ncbi:hypothetical protein LCI18_001738 [Fusarium solani-melongenae]|uniref:Uncharacterized protein n=1 Tax=Fusarium solani subsp. cucurbitae TaxID=2747967 RepID=A0ACD3YPE4_FUSSC|nr:hypothetical protein LCI18_001738 [Fusarium solani-melongenae]
MDPASKLLLLRGVPWCLDLLVTQHHQQEKQQSWRRRLRAPRSHRDSVERRTRGDQALCQPPEIWSSSRRVVGQHPRLPLLLVSQTGLSHLLPAAMSIVTVANTQSAGPLMSMGQAPISLFHLAPA